MGSRSKSQVVGHRYFLGMHMGISRGPADELLEVKVGDKPVWRGSVTDNASFPINAYDIFGGEDGEGGIQGEFTVMMGGPTQVAPPQLASVLRSPMPGFRRMLTAFFDGIVSMNSAYPKPWKFRVRRILKGWDGDVWFPETAVISLVRPVSEAETQSNYDSMTETQTINDVARIFGADASYDPLSPSPAPFTYTITLPAGATGFSLTELKVDRYADGSGLPYDTVLTLGVDYTVAGLVLTINPEFATRSLIANYSYSLTTVIPGAGGLGALGNTIIQAMNPAHILYECYTNREWGRGLPRSQMNDAAWRDIAQALYNERFGMCLRWNRTDEIQTFIQMVIDHIGAVVFSDRVTGQITPKLIRDDYSRENLPLFDTDSGLLEITDAPVTAQGPLINEVQVKYHDPVTDNDRTVRVSNLANLQVSGGEINTLKKEYVGIPTPDLASRVAKRDLRALGTNLRKFDLIFDRRASSLVPGGLVRIQDLSRNISDIVLRIGTIDYGSLSDSRIKVKAAQDVFGLPVRGFPTLPPPQWQPPNTRACVGEHMIFEMPYRSLFRSVTAAEFATIDDSSAYLGSVLAEGQPLNLLYAMAIKNGGVSSDEVPADGAYYCGYVPPGP